MEHEIIELKKQKIAELKELEKQLEQLQKNDTSDLMKKTIQDIQSLISSKQHVIYTKNKEILSLKDKISLVSENSSKIDE